MEEQTRDALVSILDDAAHGLANGPIGPPDPYLSAIHETATAALREAPVPAPVETPVAGWAYEKAFSFSQDGTYHNWHPQIHLEKPTEDGSVRNLKRLVAAALTPEAPRELDIETVAKTMWDAGEDWTSVDPGVRRLPWPSHNVGRYRAMARAVAALYRGAPREEREPGPERLRAILSQAVRYARSEGVDMTSDDIAVRLVGIISDGGASPPVSREPEIARLKAALEQAAVWFDEYAEIHRNKADQVKRGRNMARAHACRAALTEGI